MVHLPRSTPAEQGVDPAAVLAFVDAVDADAAVEVHSLMVLRHGHVVAEGWWAPHTADRTRLLYSLSKSFTSTALAFAVEEGLVGLDETALSFFPELDDEVTDPRSRSVTVRHLAAMASGHDHDVWGDALTRYPTDPVRGFLLEPPQHEPGSVFAYNQCCTYTIAAILQRVSGVRLTGYLRPRLLDPLGIGDVGWVAWPADVEQGFSGLFARTEDVARLGLLYLQRGRWEGRPLVPEWYVDEATTAQVANPHEENVDWRQGYGFQFWMSRHGYRGDGAFGQFCLVLPEQDTVVAITSGTEDMQGVLDHVWTHLLPGLGVATPDDSTPDDSAQPAMQERLAALALPVPAVRDQADVPDAVLTPTPSGETGATTLTSISVSGSGGRLEVTITEPDDSLTFAVGSREWLVSEPADAHGGVVPLAAAGGWVDEDTVRVEVIFLETPHRMDLVLSPATGTATATWRATPLTGGWIDTLHRPR